VSSAALLFGLNLMATWYLVGLIWMVQAVHYPMFDRVGAEFFSRYEADHNRLITPIVGPPMLLELATGLTLLFIAPAGFPKWAAWLGIALIAGIWLSTVTLQIPRHGELMNGFQELAHRRLVSSNWIRTVLWSLRGLLIGYFGLRMLGHG